MNTASTPKTKKSYSKSTELVHSFKNFALKGVEELRAVKVTSTFEVVKELPQRRYETPKIFSKKLIKEKTETLRIPLIEVTAEMLTDYRNNGIPSFVLKAEGKLFHATIPNNMNFISAKLLGHHMCAHEKNICMRLSAASDEKGGCEKVRNFSQSIETYPWITAGFETFNTKCDSFVVINCLHYEKHMPKDFSTPPTITSPKLVLANSLNDDDVTTVTESKARTFKTLESFYGYMR